MYPASVSIAGLRRACCLAAFPSASDFSGVTVLTIEAVEQLYPVQGAAEQLAAGGSVRVGVRDGEDLRLEFPEGWGAPADPNDARPAEGVETFKLMATTSPADFRSLLQGGFRGSRDAEVSRSPAEELLSLALGAGGSRDVARPVHVAQADAWVTVERAFILRRGAV